MSSLICLRHLSPPAAFTSSYCPPSLHFIHPICWVTIVFLTFNWAQTSCFTEPRRWTPLIVRQMTLGYLAMVKFLCSCPLVSFILMYASLSSLSCSQYGVASIEHLRLKNVLPASVLCLLLFTINVGPVCLNLFIVLPLCHMFSSFGTS